MMDRGRILRSPKMIARRRWVRREERRRRRRIVYAVALVASTAVAAVMLSGSQVFALAQIEVAGARTVGTATVVRASGLSIGQNAMSLDLAAAAEGVRALPQVRDARIERTGPLGIVIVVSERIPAIEVRSGGRRWMLDSSGAPIDARRPRRLPVLIVDEPVMPRALSPAVDPDTLRGVLRVWRGLTDRMRAQAGPFTTVHAVAAFSIGQADVVLGSFDRIARKLRVLDLVARRVRAEGSSLLSLDVRSPGHPAATIA